MRKSHWVLLVMALFMLAFAAAPVAAQQQLYATEGNDGTTNLYILDPATGGILQTVGDTGEWITGRLDYASAQFIWRAPAPAPVMVNCHWAGVSEVIWSRLMEASSA